MRFISAWASTASQNINLKVATICLAATVIGLGYSTTKLSLRVPIVIERSCFSRTVQVVLAQHSPAEIEAFLREAIPLRFDSTVAPRPNFLADTELRFREQEQSELTKRQMKQRVLVNSVTTNGSEVTVDADRLISVGKIRSAFQMQVSVSIATTDRSESNPYGLTLMKVTPIQTTPADK